MKKLEKAGKKQTFSQISSLPPTWFEEAHFEAPFAK